MNKPPSPRILLVAGLGVLLLALPFGATALDEPYAITLMSRVLIYGLAAVSLDLILGFGGMVSLGHAAFMGVGAYTVAVLARHAVFQDPLFTWPFVFTGTESGIAAWTLAVFAAAVTALAVGALSLRTRGIYFIMITLAFAQMLAFFFISLQGYGGDDGLSLFSRSTLPGLDLQSDTTFYYVCLFLLLAFTLAGRRLMRSRFGMIIRGCRENESRLAALGVNTYPYRLVCFVISGAGAGLAGALLANQTGFVSPGMMHWTVSGEILVMVVLGGMGTLFGPILGAAALLLVETVLSHYTEHWMLFLGPSLVIVVLYARQGIFGMVPARSRERV